MKSKVQRLLLGAGLLAALGAGTFALNGASSAAPANSATTVAPAAWMVDTTHSSAIFKVKHSGVSWFFGRFNGITGTITYDPKDVAASSVLIKVDTTTVDTKTKKLDDHLKSPDFFDAAQFPEMVFESESVKAGKEKDTLEVTGNLTLHGVTKPLTVTVAVTGTGEMRGKQIAGFLTTFEIDRTEFGMSYGAPSGVGAEVGITISLETAQE